MLTLLKKLTIGYDPKYLRKSVSVAKHAKHVVADPQNVKENTFNLGTTVSPTSTGVDLHLHEEDGLVAASCTGDNERCHREEGND